MVRPDLRVPASRATGETAHPGVTDGLVCPGCAAPAPRRIRAAVFGLYALLRCASCRTEFIRPQPSDERLAAIYGADYYAPWRVEDAETVDAIKRTTFAPMLDACDIREGTTLLDVGCATGSFLAEARRRGARVHGIDLNPEAIAQARRRVPDATLHVGVTADEPFAGTMFDAVVMVDFLEHVRSPQDELLIVRRWMPAGGRLVISTPRSDSLLRRLMRRHWPQYREEHLTYFSRHGLVELLDRCGFDVERVTSTRKAITLAYACGQARAYPVPVLTQLTIAAHHVLPPLRRRPVKLSLGEMTVVARRRAT